MTETMRQCALDLAKTIEDSKGQDIVVLDVSELTSWSDCFIIATVNSSAQWRGIAKAVKDFVKARDMSIYLPHRKIDDGNDWNIIDIGSIVVHLMSADARAFYDLESLWHKASRVARA